jgi:hypothetical protein
MSLLEKNCYNCQHKQDINWSAHISCRFCWQNKKYVTFPQGTEYGKSNGWYDFPYDFDPAWMEETCQYHKPKPI